MASKRLFPARRQDQSSLSGFEFAVTEIMHFTKPVPQDGYPLFI